MNFTSSPYKRMMKEVPRYEKSPPAGGPRRFALCGVSLLSKHYLYFLLPEALQRAELKC